MHPANDLFFHGTHISARKDEADSSSAHIMFFYAGSKHKRPPPICTVGSRSSRKAYRKVFALRNASSGTARDS
jgi:hypothetical protein